jgi:putative DNA primase/helicase
MLTKVTAVPFNREAGSMIWDSFLEAVFNGNAELVEFVQRFFGYAMTGDVREQVLPVFHGSGANGKSTMIEAVLAAIGPDYATKAAPDLLLAKQGQTHPTERADLFGKRFIAAVETEEGRRLNEPLIKELTGGDTMKARRMHEDFWSCRPTWKIVICTNHRPAVRGTDYGIWRRIRLVPFAKVFEGEKQDKGLTEKLRAEAEGILAWAVRGCLDWQKQGLGEPTTVREATQAYRIDQDIVGQFITDCCVIDVSAVVRARELRQALEEWAADTGQAVISPKRLSQQLGQLGVQRFRSNGVCYRGIGIRT